MRELFTSILSQAFFQVLLLIFIFPFGAEFLEQSVFQMTHVDASLFIKKISDKVVLLLAYIVDLIITSDLEEEAEQLKVGAAIGALIAFKNKMNFLQIIMGAASGVVLSHKIIRVTFDHFLHSDHADLHGYFHHLIDIVSDDLEPKHLHDQDTIFLITKVANWEKLIKLRKIKISNRNIFDASGNKTCCSVCLQDFEVGNSAGSFPKCEHKFHPECISQWLLTHNSCPLCRTTI